ncbi:MAG: VCBS repeat-containing protein [Alphaproteobacteria bacterium]|jgi:VCBS repeat-containing protein
MPKNTKGKDVDVRLSNKTDNQTHINSKDGHDIEAGQQSLSGADVGVSGARVSSDIGANHADLSLDSAWNSIKNVEVTSRRGTDVSLDNFVHTDVRLRGSEDSTVEVTGAKRGNISTGRGDDSISVDAQTNGSGWTNQFKISSGYGDDTITLNGDSDITVFKVNTGFGNDVITMVGDDYASVRANMGIGDDHFIGGSGSDKVSGGRGNDNIRTGGGNDILHAGKGNDKLDGGEGADKIHAGSGDDTIIFDADDEIIHGGKGDDTLVVDGHLDISAEKIKSVERIEMRDDAGDDSVDIDMKDARKMSETDVVKITGDAGDSVNAFDYETQLDDVRENGSEFSVFEGSKGEQIWVQHGMTMGDTVVGAPQAVESVPDIPESPKEPLEMVFLGETAAYKNTIGYYVVDEEGQITDVNFGFENASRVNSGGELVSGESTAGMDVPEGAHLEFFIIANGFYLNKEYSRIDLEEGELKFANSEGGIANIHDDSVPELTFTSVDGETTALKGYVYHTSNDNLNIDGETHALVELNEDGNVVISFEDLKGLGDADYDDSVFQVNVGDNIVDISGIVFEDGVVVPTEPVDLSEDELTEDPIEEPAEKPIDALDDVFLAEEGTALDISFSDITANDVLPISGMISGITPVTEHGGQVIFNFIDRIAHYTPAEGFFGEDTFTYNVTDMFGNTDTATVTVNVQPVEVIVAPVDALDDAFDAVEDEALEINVADLLANDVDPAGNGLTVTSVSVNTVAGGVVDFNPETGVFSYTPTENYNGPDSFTYEVTDSEGNVDVATVQLNVAPVNDVPVALDDAFSTDEDVALNLSVAELLANDSDVEGDDLTVTAIDAVSANGAVVAFNPETGEISYTPVADFNGEDTISYTVSDGNGGESTAEIVITVNPVNDVPVALDDTFSTDEDVALNLSVAELLANDSDVEGDDLTVTAIDAVSANGAVVAFNPETGEISYTPVADFNGEDTILYTVSDGNGGESTAEIVITVNPVNDVPVALDDTFSTDEDVALNLSVAELLANDSDVEGDDLTVTAIDAVSANGAVVAFNPETGEISYTPVADFNGEDTVSYTVTDGNGGESTAVVTITVKPILDAPVAGDIHGDAVEDGEAIVLDGNVDNADGGQLFYTLSSAPDEGTIVNNNDGTFTFDVGNAFQDLDSGETRDIQFSYQVTDMQGNFSVANAIVTVAGINDAPDARDVSITSTEDLIAEVTRNFNVSDVDDEPVTITLLNALDPQTEGVVVNNGDGTFTFTPALDAFDYLNAGEEVTFSVNYLASDGDASDTAALTFTVTGVNDATVAEEIIIDDVVDDGEPIIIDIGGTVTDLDGNDTVTITVPTPPNPETEGELIDNGDGTFTFEPATTLEELDDGETQEITFEYVVTDEEGNTVTETVTIIVSGTNDAPVAQDIQFSTTEDNAVTTSFDATDVDDEPLTYSIVSAPDAQTEGVVAIGLNGQFSFTPAAALNALAEGEIKVVNFTYRVSDGDAEDTAQATVTVVGTNDNPVVEDITMNHMEEQAPHIFDIKPFVSDPDSDDNASSLTYTVAQPTKGQLTNLGDGLIELDPKGEFDYLAEGEVANLTAVLQVKDSHGGTTAKTIVIRVTGENDAPVAEIASVTTSEDGSMNILMPVSDVDGDSLDISFVNAPAENILELNLSGQMLTVTPGEGLQYLDNGETAEFSVTYNVTDGSIITQNVLNITVTGTNDAPVIEDINQTMLEDAGTVTGLFTGFDYEGDDIIYLVQTPPKDADGFVTIDNVTGEFTFNVNESLDSLQVGETKVVSFTYVATDGKDTSSPQTVEITIEGQNDAPVLTDVAVSVGEDDGTRTFSLGVSDADNAVNDLTYTLDSAPEFGSVVLNGDGTFNFNPNDSFQYLNDGETADVNFTYTVSDGAAFVSKTATITVMGTNDVPVVSGAFFVDPFHVIERYEFNFDVDRAFDNLNGTEVITFTDNNGDAAPSWISYSASEGKVVARPAANKYGEYEIQMHINDGSNIVTQAFTLYVDRVLESLDTSSIINGSGDDNKTGTDAGEYISVNAGDDIVHAGAGNDVIYGGSGNDILYGEDGDDTFLLTGVSGTDGSDQIFGGDGYDKIVFHESFVKTFELDGDYSNASNSIEEFVSSGSRVNISNGSGDDVMDFSNITFDGAFRIYGGNGNDIMTGSIGDDYLNGSGGNDTIYGGLGNDDLYGSAGNDELYGGLGNDYLEGGSGADNIYGGEGSDTIAFSADDVIVDGGVGDFDILSMRANVDFTALATDYSNLEALDLDGGNYSHEITIGLDDVIDMKDTSIDTLYILGDSGDNVATGGEFSIATRIDVVDTNGDGNTDTTFQVYASSLQSDIYIGIEMGVNMTIDGIVV